MTLTAADIKPGRVYEAKRPELIGNPARPNDRLVVSVMGLHSVYWKSPLWTSSRITSFASFINWAARDITDEMPREGDRIVWRTELPKRGEK